ncbi:hypothetical protein WB904_002798 [Vibrio parahaemolyticus]
MDLLLAPLLDLKFSSTVTIGNVLVFFSLLIATLGLLVNLVQLRRNYKVNKAQFLQSVVSDLFEDSEFRKFWYRVDYNQFHFNEKCVNEFIGSEDERHLDALLIKYNILCRYVRMGLLKKNEVEFLLFDIARAFHNPSVIAYISWLENEYKLYGNIGESKRNRPFDDLQWFIERIKK